MLPGVLALAGCSGGSSRGSVVTRFLQGEFLSKKNEISTQQAAMTRAESPQIIAKLQARRSVLTPKFPYVAVADAVMASSARTAEAELRAARLRAQAASKNWLSSFGRNISLNSLGELVTSILIEQVIYDDGRKQAERACAALAESQPYFTGWPVRAEAPLGPSWPTCWPSPWRCFPCRSLTR